jgi:GNAT superfamily N-acetyltransferase
VDSDLATALAAERAIVRRAVTAAREIDGGWVVRHPPLPDVWHLNRVHLTGGRDRLDWSRLEALVTRELAGVPHRRVTLDDADAAEDLWPALEGRGWRRERTVVMVRDGAAPASREPPGRPRARAIDALELAAFQPLAFAEDAAVTAISPGLAARLADAQVALRAGTDWRAFGAGHAAGAGPAAGAGTAAGGLPLSTATLYLDPDVGRRRVAFVDQVATLRAHRERGLARAVMTAALRLASDWDAGLVALFADAEDWPQVFYASLGFETVGRQTVFHRDD